MQKNLKPLVISYRQKGYLSAAISLGTLIAQAFALGNEVSAQVLRDSVVDEAKVAYPKDELKISKQTNATLVKKSTSLIGKYLTKKY